MQVYHTEGKQSIGTRIGPSAPVPLKSNPLTLILLIIARVTPPSSLFCCCCVCLFVFLLWFLRKLKIKWHYLP